MKDEKPESRSASPSLMKAYSAGSSEFTNPIDAVLDKHGINVQSLKASFRILALTEFTLGYVSTLAEYVDRLDRSLEKHEGIWPELFPPQDLLQPDTKIYHSQITNYLFINIYWLLLGDKTNPKERKEAFNKANEFWPVVDDISNNFYIKGMQYPDKDIYIVPAVLKFIAKQVIENSECHSYPYELEDIYPECDQ